MSGPGEPPLAATPQHTSLELTMSQVVSRAFEAQAHAAKAGNFAAIARDYLIPAPIFLFDRVLRAETPAEVLTFLKLFFKVIAEGGTKQVSKELIDMSPLPNSARLCIVQCNYLDENGRVLGSTKLRQWCREIETGMQIELTEVLSLPFGLEAQDILEMYAYARKGAASTLAPRVA